MTTETCLWLRESDQAKTSSTLGTNHRETQKCQRQADSAVFPLQEVFPFIQRRDRLCLARAVNSRGISIVFKHIALPRPDLRGMQNTATFDKRCKTAGGNRTDRSTLGLKRPLRRLNGQVKGWSTHQVKNALEGLKCLFHPIARVMPIRFWAGSRRSLCPENPQNTRYGSQNPDVPLRAGYLPFRPLAAV
ncbi:Uncharacterised protein [Bordetella avium]|nr:Uncharacterised protein [Bordetella avium]